LHYLHSSSRRRGVRTATSRLAILLVSGFVALPAACAQSGAVSASGSRPLLDVRAAAADPLLTPSSAQVTVTRSPDQNALGLVVSIAPGTEGYPGVAMKPAGGLWDLSKYGHVAVHVVNTGANPITVSLRVDNAGNWQDNPWNAESVTLQPGASGTVTTIFGYSYGYKPGYHLNPSAVTQLLLFALKTDAAQSFRVESLVADGPADEKPPVAPDDVRTKPRDGKLTGPEVQVDTAGGAAVSAAPSGAALRLSLPGGAGEHSVSLRPPAGRWDLRDDLEVRVAVRNAGAGPASLRARVESNGGATDWFSLPAPLAPGASGQIVVPFQWPAPLPATSSGSGRRFTSDTVSRVTIATADGAPDANVILEGVRAGVPPPPKLPDWLGKRPPAEGDWVETLDQKFNGSSVDTSVWNVTGPNYYDKVTHWTKSDLLVGDGVLRIRYEKKSGFQNDDPTQPRLPYAAGFLNTFGKWTQRYGYFEARMKLPTAPGLWPAFWMMPDRGPASAPEWQRSDTANGGMEFDIMEYLSRWGPYRYNIAMHYDGYQKDHKSVGSDCNYVQPDRDGYITCGLLWLPGLAAYYCNGREILRWENPRISNVPSYLMFTLPSGGWDNSPLDDSRLPDDLVVDYVRVWQRKDLVGR
jgi:beta-glucanase (GH16 family)